MVTNAYDPNARCSAADFISATRWPISAARADNGDLLSPIPVGMGSIRELEKMNFAVNNERENGQNATSQDVQDFSLSHCIEGDRLIDA